jgi:hypothetical protein
MSRDGKATVWLVVAAAVIAGIVAVFLIRLARRTMRLTLEGAVIRLATQADKEVPLAGVQVTAESGRVFQSDKSDASGFFRLTLILPRYRWRRRPAALLFQYPGYRPLKLPVTGGNRLYIAKMVLTRPPRRVTPHTPQIAVSNISVRYSANNRTAVNVGSSVKTFQVANAGNVPCRGRSPCSLNGRWKAARVSVSMDAGPGNIFRDTRISCIAGPCPFTQVTPQSLPRGTRTLSVTVLDWSDTTTFLLEAEVFHPMLSARVRKSYPLIVGRVLNFTVPASAEEIALEADLGGTTVFFPLGPGPISQLKWADCLSMVNKSRTRVYRCTLAAGYRF